MKIEVCTGKSCKGRFSEYILTRIKNDIEKYKISGVDCSTCLCTGNCQKWPNVLFDGKREEHMNPAKASKKFLDTIKK